MIVTELMISKIMNSRETQNGGLMNSIPLELRKRVAVAAARTKKTTTTTTMKVNYQLVRSLKISQMI